MFQPASLPSLKGRVFLVTGGNTGCGFETCLALAAKDAKIYLGARSLTKAEKAIAEIKTQYPSAELRPLILDHNSLDSVVAAAKDFKKQEKSLHGLILNAGIMDYDYELTPDGFDIQMQVNYLAHWVLTDHLIPVLLATSLVSGPGSVRVICVSSEGHIYNGVKKLVYENEDLKNMGAYQRYGQSKLGNVLHAMTLNDRYGPDSESARSGKGEIWTASLHPGFINTQMNEHNRDRLPAVLSWLHAVFVFLGIIRPRSEGCVSSVFTGASPDFTKEMSGKYFSHKAKVKAMHKCAADPNVRDELETWTGAKMKAGGWTQQS